MQSETARIEAFSDGVFAIAITLLILDLKVPPLSVNLGTALLRQWPSYVAYLISFWFIGIMWVNHHRLFTHIRKANNELLFLNLLLLLGISAVPFPTALVAAHFYAPDRTQAIAIFNGLYVVLAIFFNLFMAIRCASRVVEHRHAGISRVYLPAVRHRSIGIRSLLCPDLGKCFRQPGAERCSGRLFCNPASPSTPPKPLQRKLISETATKVLHFLVPPA